VEAYKRWLESQVDIDDVLDYAEKRMKELNVVRRVKKGAVS